MIGQEKGFREARLDKEAARMRSEDAKAMVKGAEGRLHGSA